MLYMIVEQQDVAKNSLTRSVLMAEQKDPAKKTSFIYEE